MMILEYYPEQLGSTTYSILARRVQMLVSRVHSGECADYQNQTDGPRHIL